MAKDTAHEHGSSRTEGKGENIEEGTMRRPPPCPGESQGLERASAGAGDSPFHPLVRHMQGLGWTG